MIILKVNELENVCFSDMQNFQTVNTLSADDKYSLLNRDNLKQRFQMQLSQKSKAFSQFFFAFLKSTLNLELFRKKK